MAGDTAMGGGQAVRQANKLSFGAYSPGHYLKQFLPKYSSVEAVNARAKQEGFETGVQMLHFKKDWELNPDLPVLGPWRSVRPINTPIWLLERNPYYYAVDTAGNQLPYFDKVQFSLAENLEVVNLRAMAGEDDEQERHIDLGKLPVLLDNQQKGNYKVHLDLGFAGSDFMFHVNQSFTADAEIRKWLTNTDFRRALSLGIDRDQLNETFWLGVGTPGSPAPGESMPQSPGPEWRKKWSTYDPALANKMLDGIGLAKRDADGYRLRTDNGDRLRLQVIAIAAFLPYPKLSEMVADQWRKIGIQADVREMERGLGFGKLENNEHQLFVWNNGGTELLYLFPTWAVPVITPGSAFGPAYAAWYASGGKQGTKPDDPNILKIYDLYSEAAGLKAEGRNHNAQEIWKILVDQRYRDRHGRSIPGGLGRASGFKPAGEYCRPGVQCTALPHPRELPSGDMVLQDMTLNRPPSQMSSPPLPQPPPARGGGVCLFFALAHADLPGPPPRACGDHRLRHHAGDLRHPSPAAGRFRQRLRRAGKRRRYRDLGCRGGCAAPRLWPQSTVVGAVTGNGLRWLPAATSAAPSSTGGR